MKKLFSILTKIVKILCKALVILFVVYFWDFDQKLMAWAYTMVNKIFDEKKVDIKF